MIKAEHKRDKLRGEKQLRQPETLQQLSSWLTRPETSKAAEQDVSIRKIESTPSTCLLCLLCFALYEFGVKRCHGSRD